MKKKVVLTSEEALAVARSAAASGAIEIAEQDELEHYDAEADEICGMLRRVLGIRVTFLSDQSSFGDFYKGDDAVPDWWYERLSEGLGTVIRREDTIVNVCRRIREQKQTGTQ